MAAPNIDTASFWQKYRSLLETLCIFLLAAAVRLTSLNVFLAVDEEDRWAWAVAFYQALLAGDLPGTLVGDGYPGIFPVWLETLWLLAASLYRSLLRGGFESELIRRELRTATRGDAAERPEGREALVREECD